MKTYIFKNSNAALIPLFAFLFPVFWSGCGKYPEQTELPAVHSAGLAQTPGAAELTGQNYQPAFLQPGCKTLEVNYDIKEKIIDIGGGFKYRALTFDGNFPAKTIVAEQGTLVKIKLTNSDSSPHSIHTHVIKYKPESDGARLSQLQPGKTQFYYWEVTDTTPEGFYPLHDHGGDNEGALARGLLGMISVVKPGQISNPGVGILLHDIDAAYLFSDSGASTGMGGGGGGHGGGHGGMGGGTTMGGDGTPIGVPAHLINGKFGEAPETTFRAKKGDKVRVGVVNLGSNPHTFHPHGNFFRESGGKIDDNLALQPGGFQTVELEAQAVGNWLYHCHIPGHPEGGMWGKYVVTE